MTSMSTFGVAIPLLLFFLEAMQDEHRFGKLDRVDRAVRTASIVFYDLKHAGTSEALERLCGVVLIADLCQ